jgi:spermidine/putrescine transport system substrate-binding protein
MNYVYEPANAARISAYIQYPPSVKGVREELQKMGGETAALADSKLMFPDEALLDSLYQFGQLSEEEEAKFDEEFSRISGV